MKTILIVALALTFSQATHAASFCLDNGARAVYKSGGTYVYHQGGRKWRGTWSGSPTPGGSVTVRMENGRVRHDSFGTGYLQNHDGNGRFGGRFC